MDDVVAVVDEVVHVVDGAGAMDLVVDNVVDGVDAHE